LAGVSEILECEGEREEVFTHVGEGPIEIVDALRAVSSSALPLLSRDSGRAPKSNHGVVCWLLSHAFLRPITSFLQCLKQITLLTYVWIRRRLKQVCNLRPQSRPCNQFHLHITLGDSDPPQRLQNQRPPPEFVHTQDSISSKYLTDVEKHDRNVLEFIAAAGDKTVIFVSPYISCSPCTSNINSKTKGWLVLCCRRGIACCVDL
jgi:hypothetical protein